MTINQQLIRSEIKDYVLITIGLLLYASAFTVFLMPYEIVTGGVTGLSAIIYYATQFKLENTYMIVNLALLGVALKILGIKFLMKTIYAIVALYFMLKFAQELMPLDASGNFIKILGEDQKFMSLIVGCCITGTGMAVIFLNGGSMGGTDIVAACINKYKNISLGQVLMAVDICIIGSCMLFPQFGSYLERLHKVVFGLCTMFIECFILDHVMNLRRQSVQFLIFSKKYEEIADAIMQERDRGITILDGHGWYTGKDVKVICLMAKRNESQSIFRIVKIIDPLAFVSQSSVIGVYGEGFDIPETADTLEGNASIKSHYIYDNYRLNCFADDTGLEVDALGGEPGVRSARYDEHTDHDSEANMRKLLCKLGDTTNRKAHFRTVISLIIDGKEHQFEGRVDGYIATKKSGTEGFGYDPIFIPEGYDKSFAELGEDIKNQISHRARAVRKLAEYLKQK